jgi:hypothetical protein
MTITTRDSGSVGFVSETTKSLQFLLYEISSVNKCKTIEGLQAKNTTTVK